MEQIQYVNVTLHQGVDGGSGRSWNTSSFLHSKRSGLRKREELRWNTHHLFSHCLILSEWAARAPAVRVTGMWHLRNGCTEASVTRQDLWRRCSSIKQTNWIVTLLYNTIPRKHNPTKLRYRAREFSYELGFVVLNRGRWGTSTRI